VLSTLAAALLLAAPPSSVDKLKVTLVKLTASEQKPALTKVVNGQLQPLKGCYDLALKDNADLKGELEVMVSLEGGTVTNVTPSVTSPVNDDTVTQCIMARLRSATWPKTKAAVDVTVRLKLSR